MKRVEKHLRPLGALLVVVGLVVITISRWFDQPATQYPAFTMFVLGLYAWGLSDFQSRMARMQAALDMKQFAMEMTRKDALAVQEVVVRLDGGDVALKARDGTEFKIKLKGIAPDHASLRVEYLG